MINTKQLQFISDRTILKTVTVGSSISKKQILEKIKIFYPSTFCFIDYKLI